MENTCLNFEIEKMFDKVRLFHSWEVMHNKLKLIESINIKHIKMI